MHDPDIWRLLFEQTPKLIQWALGVLTLGLFTLAAAMWRRREARLQTLETDSREYATKEDINEVRRHIDRGFRGIHSRIDEMYFHLTVTRKRPTEGGDDE